MSLDHHPIHADALLTPSLTSFYWLGENIRSRSAGNVILTGTVDVPVLPLRLTADCDREISKRLALEPGDVEALSLARALRRWPDFGQWTKAVSDWIQAQGLPSRLGEYDSALMACRGARYHHDAEQYGGMAFCNLFLSEDKGLDLHFPNACQRIPLKRGTVVIFDTAQPHGVIERSADRFTMADFAPPKDRSLLFLTWELPLENAHIASALGIDFDNHPETAEQLTEEQVWLNGERVSVCPESGEWLRAGVIDTV